MKKQIIFSNSGEMPKQEGEMIARVILGF